MATGPTAYAAPWRSQASLCRAKAERWNISAAVSLDLQHPVRFRRDTGRCERSVNHSALFVDPINGWPLRAEWRTGP